MKYFFNYFIENQMFDFLIVIISVVFVKYLHINLKTINEINK